MHSWYALHAGLRVGHCTRLFYLINILKQRIIHSHFHRLLQLHLFFIEVLVLCFNAGIIDSKWKWLFIALFQLSLNKVVVTGCRSGMRSMSQYVLEILSSIGIYNIVGVSLVAALSRSRDWFDPLVVSKRFSKLLLVISVWQSFQVDIQISIVHRYVMTTICQNYRYSFFSRDLTEILVVVVEFSRSQVPSMRFSAWFVIFGSHAIHIFRCNHVSWGCYDFGRWVNSLWGFRHLAQRAVPSSYLFCLLQGHFQYGSLVARI